MGHALELNAAWVLKNEPAPLCRVTCLATGKRGIGKTGEIHLPLCSSLSPSPHSSASVLAGWEPALWRRLRVGRRVLFLAYRNWDPPEPRRRGGGGASRPAGECTARTHPGPRRPARTGTALPLR